MLCVFPAHAGYCIDMRRAPGHDAPTNPLEPEAAEVESARLLANEADELRALGLDDDEIRRWADEYVAEDVTRPPFVAWVRARLERPLD
jgi:hypothetical protein